MRTFLKYQCESPLPAGHIERGQPGQSHTPPCPHLAGSGAWMGHKAKLHNCAASFLHGLPISWTSSLNSCSVGLSTLFIISMLSARADQFLLRGTFFWRREEISTNSQALLNLVKPWRDFFFFSDRLRRMVFGATNLHRVSFSKKCNPSLDN